MYDLVIYNGLIVTTSHISPVDTWIGITGDKIVTIQSGKPPKDVGKRYIDAKGGYITPGGIDTHVHLQQLQVAPGEDTGDTFESGTRSATAGGTTTIIAFANQQRHDESLYPLVEEYHRRAAANGTWCDYGFHMILTNPTKKILDEELPVLFEKEGISSIKVYMTYEARRVGDRDMLEIMLRTRKLGMTLMIHAENDDMVQLVIDHLKENDLTEPHHHAIARTPLAEVEATNRAICLSNLVSSPILIVHVSSSAAMSRIRTAQNDLQPIFAETCPQYLLMLAEAMQPSGHGCGCSHGTEKTENKSFEGAKLICSPPLRESKDDLDAVWKGMINGTVTTFSSDHCPSAFDHPMGKKKGLQGGKADFTKVPNGLPGVETRLPLLMTYGVERQRISVQRFVEVTSTQPAHLYGLQHRKGAIAVGMDADIVIWYPPGEVKHDITNDNLHHSIDYTPFEGFEVSNWPRDNGGLVGRAGLGTYVKRIKGTVGHESRGETHLERITRMARA
ncbi:dihydropyrimidinase [Kwoniella shandongensis]|uniref:dihydropyrimidinase n=1 Tax=Kwoniella shandongensis TaxID=1734106 RepID=A0AAJ8LHX0_9TREE